MFTLSGVSPAEGEKHVAIDTLIEFTIVDDGTGIDISSLIVEVNMTRAIDGTTFNDGFDGVFSEITPSGDNFSIVIDPEDDFSLGEVVSVKIQVKNLEDFYFNRDYAFKILPDEPILTVTSPLDEGTVTGPQLIHLEFEDTIHGIDTSSIDISINGLDYIVSGAIETSPNGAFTEIISGTNDVIVRVDTVEPLRDGDYILSYAVADTLGNFLTGELNFTVNQPILTLPDVFPQTGFLGWFQGIERVSDVGDGQSLKIEWHEPVKRIYKSEVFVLVFENERRLELFDSDPKYMALSSISEATAENLRTGLTLSYGARAMETYPDTFDVTGMVEADDSFYIIPDPVTVTETVTETDTIIRVNSVAGYPERGLLTIGREVIKYTALNTTDPAFLVPVNGRGLNNTTPGIYVAGDEAKLFLKCQDSNTVIIMATPTYQDWYVSERPIDNEGLVVTDYQDNDMKFFQGYDFCGYHDPLPQQTLQGIDDCPSYLGGEFNGFRGMNLYDRMLNREEVLLDQVGEPVVLLKRIWDGATCSCLNARKIHPKVKSCEECFGTGYIGGYDQFLNLRRDDRRIMVSFNESPEDLKLGPHEHLQQEYEPGAWTLPIPAIRDRDLLLRFDFTDDVEYIYEVLNTSKEKVFFRHFGRQKLALKRLDKTDIVYTLVKSAYIDNTFIPSIT